MAETEKVTEKEPVVEAEKTEKTLYTNHRNLTPIWIQKPALSRMSGWL